MRQLSGSDSPRYVSDRLSAVSNVPMQFLVSAGVVATILTATSFADLAKKGEAVGSVDAQQTASIVRATEQTAMTGGPDRCRPSASSGPSSFGS